VRSIWSANRRESKAAASWISSAQAQQQQPSQQGIEGKKEGLRGSDGATDTVAHAAVLMRKKRAIIAPQPPQVVNGISLRTPPELAVGAVTIDAASPQHERLSSLQSGGGREETNNPVQVDSRPSSTTVAGQPLAASVVVSSPAVAFESSSVAEGVVWDVDTAAFTPAGGRRLRRSRQSGPGLLGHHQQQDHTQRRCRCFDQGGACEGRRAVITWIKCAAIGWCVGIFIMIAMGGLTLVEQHVDKATHLEQRQNHSSPKQHQEQGQLGQGTDNAGWPISRVLQHFVVWGLMVFFVLIAVHGVYFNWESMVFTEEQRAQRQLNGEGRAAARREAAQREAASRRRFTADAYMR
jgi:hypothetical protein